MMMNDDNEYDDDDMEEEGEEEDGDCTFILLTPVCTELCLSLTSKEWNSCID